MTHAKPYLMGKVGRAKANQSTNSSNYYCVISSQKDNLATLKKTPKNLEFKCPLPHQKEFTYASALLTERLHNFDTTQFTYM